VEEVTEPAAGEGLLEQPAGGGDLPGGEPRVLTRDRDQVEILLDDRFLPAVHRRGEQLIDE
jgi:hypothetical protein